MKKVVILILIVLIIAAILALAPQVGSRLSQSQGNTPQVPAPTTTPSPAPLVKIDDNSNLSDEAEKLNVPEFNEDFQKLDQELSSF